jgi:hypothetical protein
MATAAHGAGGLDLKHMESGMMVDMAKRYFGTVYQP